MRDILDILQQLNESTGLAGRKHGDVFKNPAGDTITFDNLRFFPEGGGKYEPEQMDQAVADIEQQCQVQWQNNRSPRSGGFAVATFTAEDGPLYIGRYLESVKLSVKDNQIPNSVGDYRFSGKAAVKAQSGLSPQDLLTDKLNLNIPAVMKQLSMSLGTDHPLYAVAHRLASGEPLPMEIPIPEGISFSAFTNYFCEILQPMALITGQFKGDAGEAAERFLGGSFAGALIDFDDSKTAGLSDSIIHTVDGKSVKVSTKAGKGAYASAKNLLDSVEELQLAPNGQAILNEHGEIINLLQEIKSAGQAGAPLMLGVRYGIISQEDADAIMDLKNGAPTDLNKISEMGLSPTLQKLAKGRSTSNPEETNLYYHLMAAVAFAAADQVNEKTTFTEAATSILNNSALVQVYTLANEGKTSWTLNMFDTVYPGKSIKGVYLNASKTYYSTGIKGNFTFKIDRGQGVPKDDADAVTPKISAMPLTKAADIITKGPRPKQKPHHEVTSDREEIPGLGRSKRPK